MIDISPKALRFARLAAEQQPAFAHSPQIAVMERDEIAFRQENATGRSGRYVQISEPTANFCIRVVSALLEQSSRFNSSEWDGNDYAFLQAATKSLRDQLMQSGSRSL